MAENLILILGGARSGKSAYAQQLAKQAGSHVLYIATARVHDEEMEKRVAIHRASRPGDWDTLEVAGLLTEALSQKNSRYDAILLDCVTLLLGGAFLLAGENASEEEYTKGGAKILEDLILSMEDRPEPWIIVSNEVGLGIVPDTLMGRVFRDIQGRANQVIASKADSVYFLAAGIPLKIK
jgi:adenosylcobinamide kinase/adenosylcobinamide-phosphate guanylyltransferase